jgi:hypothetical protein
LQECLSGYDIRAASVLRTGIRTIELTYRTIKVIFQSPSNMRDALSPVFNILFDNSLILDKWRLFIALCYTATALAFLNDLLWIWSWLWWFVSWPVRILLGILRSIGFSMSVSQFMVIVLAVVISAYCLSAVVEVPS